MLGSPKAFLISPVVLGTYKRCWEVKFKLSGSLKLPTGCKICLSILPLYFFFSKQDFQTCSSIVKIKDANVVSTEDPGTFTQGTNCLLQNFLEILIHPYQGGKGVCSSSVGPCILMFRRALKHWSPFVLISVIKQLTEWVLDTCLKSGIALALCYVESCGLYSCGWCVQLLSVLPWLVLLIWYPFPALADSFLSCFFLGLAMWKRKTIIKRAASAHWLLPSRRCQLL